MTIEQELQAVISAFFKVDINCITDWCKLKGGNHVRSFCVNSEKFVIRKLKLPHPDTVAAEKAAYAALKPMQVTDEVLYLDDAGIKIARFIEGAHLGYGEQDQENSINLLRNIHKNAPSIPYSYNLFNSINYWASLCHEPNLQNLETLSDFQPAIDALKTKLDSMNITQVLCNGDYCVNGNMLRLKDGSIRIIDWEYAGMADPFQDLALASVHQGTENIDPFMLLERYLQRKPSVDEIFRMKAFVALANIEIAVWQINDLSVQEFPDWLVDSMEGL